MTSQQSVAFVVPHPYVEALACFREPIAYLADAGWHVDLYTTLSPAHPPPFFGREAVRLVPIEMTRRGAVDLMARLVFHRPRYRWIVAVPQWGLHYASLAARHAGIPVGCISDELKTDAESVTDSDRRWRLREQRAHRRCAWTIALSDERAAFVRAENRLDPSHPIFVVPNAPAGSSCRAVSRYFHDTLALPADQRVLLHAGSFWWPAAQRLGEEAQGWTSNWTVVFQLRLYTGLNGWRDSGSVRFARNVLPAAMLDHAVSSATIGLSLYDDRIANNRLMGTASGKTLRYLRNGLPVIATRAGGFHWIEREGCGVLIDDVREVHAAAERIWSEYDSFAGHARGYYDRALRFESHFVEVARAMEAA